MIALRYLWAWAYSRKHRPAWRRTYVCGGLVHSECLSCGGERISDPDLALE